MSEAVLGGLVLLGGVLSALVGYAATDLAYTWARRPRTVLARLEPELEPASRALAALGAWTGIATPNEVRADAGLKVANALATSFPPEQVAAGVEIPPGHLGVYTWGGEVVQVLGAGYGQANITYRPRVYDRRAILTTDKPLTPRARDDMLLAWQAATTSAGQRPPGQTPTLGAPPALPAAPRA
jgi:hypothetical protein